MPYSRLIREALTLAKQGIYVFPVNATTKRPVWSKEDSPNGRGGHLAATTDPEEIKKLFERGDGIGVHLKSSGLIAFDVDFREGADETNDKLDAWVAEHLEPDLEEEKVRVHISQNKGEHWIYRYDERNGRPPGAIFPELQVKWDGYIIWPTEGSKYIVDEDVPIDQLANPHPDALIVQEAKRGQSGDGGLLSWDDAIEIMEGDAEGQRHEALNAIAFHVVKADPDLALEDACDLVRGTVERHMRAGKRRDELTEVRYEPDSELVRSVRPLMEGGRLRSHVAGDAGTERLAKVLGEVGQVDPFFGLEPAVPDGLVLFKDYALMPKEPPPPWLIENFLREGATMSIVGMSGVGKTTITASWVAGLVAGRPDVVGLPDVGRPLNIAWLNPEQEAGELREDVDVALETHGLRQMGKLFIVGDEVVESGLETGLALVVVDPQDRKNVITNEALLEKIVEELRGQDIDMIILDPITEFNDGNENDRGHAKKLHFAFRRIAKALGCATMYFSHTGKPPDGKKPDWYVDQLMAERGSSQNIGSVKVSANLAPVIPGGLKAAQAWEHYGKAKNPSSGTRNFVQLKIVKIKRSDKIPHLFYELIPSKVDSDVAVAIPVDEGEILAAGDESLYNAVTSRSYADRILAAMPHGGIITAYQMKEILPDVTKAKRPDWEYFKDVLDALQTPVAVEDTTVQIIHEGGTKNGAYRVVVGDK